MQRIIRAICLMLVAAGIAMAAPMDNTIIPDQTINATAVTFGPFNNFGGTNKEFTLTGSVDIVNANTSVDARFLWNPVASASSPTAGSQYFTTPYPASGTSQTYDIGHKLLLGPCPQTVWVQIRSNKSINIHSFVLGHTCNVAQTNQEIIVATNVLPGASPPGLLLLGLILAVLAGFILYRSRRTWSTTGMA